MRYIAVTWALCEGQKPAINYFTYTTDLENLEKGDSLLVLRNGKETIGVFSHYLEKDWNPKQLPRIGIIKKVHTNTVKSLVRKRYEEFKDFKIGKSKSSIKSRKKKFRKIFELEDERLIYRKLMRMICLGNRILTKKDVNEVEFYYKNIAVALRKEVSGEWYVRDVFIRKYVKWVRPMKAHYALVNLLEAEPEKRTKL